MDRFPAVLFPPAEWQWRIDGASLMGGQPISGAPQTADMSAGGWWVCEWSPAMLFQPAQYSQWRMYLGRLNSGVGLVEMPLIDSLQPYPPGSRVVTADPSGAPITLDPSLGDLTADLITAQLAADAYMPAWPNPPVAPTQAQIQISVGAALQGGEYFSVYGPSGSVRLHMITELLAIVGEVATVSVVPPFREDMDAGTALDFNNPRCTMKLDIASAKDAWPKLSGAMVSRPTIRFLESGFVIPPE